MTAYEMRISDWSSDVCSSDLIETCTNLRSARNWARLTATGERYMKASSILETIGDTPHIRMNRLFGSAEVWIKSERSNPAGSIKDRIALSMVEAAEKSGELKPGGTIIEQIGRASCRERVGQYG